MAKLLGLPLNPSNSVSLSVSVLDVAAYRFKVGVTGVVNCADPQGYSPESLGVVSLSADLSSVPDGSISLCVVGKNDSGTYQDFSNATGATWVKDSIGPTSPTIFEDGEFNFSASDSPALNWGVSSDLGTGLAKYQISLGEISGGNNILNWTDLPNTLSHDLKGLTLGGNKRYFTALRAIDQAGNFSSPIMGDGWWNFAKHKLAVDSSSPVVRTLDENAHFGSETAMSSDGTTYIVGAPYDDTDSIGANYIADAGAVFVYVKSNGSWLLQQKIVAQGVNARMSSDHFGSSVSIYGDTIVVGSPDQDYDEFGVNSKTDCGAVFVFTRSNGVWALEQKLVATGPNGRNSMDQFGRSVSISGDTISVGAPAHDFDAIGSGQLADAGAVFLFNRAMNTWSLQQKLVGASANGRVAGDQFGWAVSIETNTLAVGAPYQDFDEGGNNSLLGSGAVFIFHRDGGVWSLQQKLSGTGPNGRMSGDAFGTSVAINNNTLVVGAPFQHYDSTGANYILYAGAAYVFTSSMGVWNFEQKLTGSGINGRGMTDQFGMSVAIDGNTIVVGVPTQDFDSAGGTNINDSGAVFIFLRSGIVWSLQQKIVASGLNSRMASDHFGMSVAVAGDVVGVGSDYHSYDASGSIPINGAGAVFMFLRTGSSWAQTTKIVDTVVPYSRSDLAYSRFGLDVSISEDGSTMVVGAPGDSYDETGHNFIESSGSVYVYIKAGDSWIFQQKLVGVGGNSRNSYDNFGRSVSISGDVIAIGAPYHSYDSSGGNFQSSAGAVFFFSRSAGVWTFEQKVVGSGLNGRNVNDNFGDNVSISGDTAVVGVHNHDFDSLGGDSKNNAGAAFVFKRTGGLWSLEQRIVAQGVNARNSGDFFGASVDISSDTIAIGANGHGYDENGANHLWAAGAVFVYTRTGTNWILQQKIVADGLNGRVFGDNYGTSVAIDSNCLVVGSLNEFDSNGANAITLSGSAFVYERNSEVWSLTQKLSAFGINSREEGGAFGSSVAIDGTTILIGAPGQSSDELGNNSLSYAGAAYLFSKDGNIWLPIKKLVGFGTGGRNEADHFGDSVVVSENGSNDGYTIVVGATNQDFSSAGTIPSYDTGAVFSFY
jgi:hypothetical protein